MEEYLRLMEDEGFSHVGNDSHYNGGKGNGVYTAWFCFE
jgi:hypothetical protein